MSFNYDRGKELLIDKLSFHIRAGEVVGLIGPPGCGKSTLIQLINEFLSPWSGNIVKADKFVANIFQEGRLLPWLNVNKNILFSCACRDGCFLKNKNSVELMKAVGLDPSLLFFYPYELSGGMKQRVALARALAIKPRCMIMDEPVNALDYHYV